ncbi:hypothetical protein GGR58DRAFT_382745 [Xylaria digitata]|nr:hypothetical protein GGR58DRAFT_382745 [Xylaria digitata]
MRPFFSRHNRAIFMLPVLTFGNDRLPPLFPDVPTASNQLPQDIGISISTRSSAVTPSLPAYPNFEFELSPQSVSFLDSIFLQGHDTAEPIMNWGNMLNSTAQLIDEPQNSSALTENLYCTLEIKPEILDGAIDAYFSFTSLALPVLSKDGFMADYKAQQSSSALVFAVACRGCPFIQATDKWELQQRFASRFKEAFLQARNTTSSQDLVRLDDLEALALMVDFEYEGSVGAASPLQSQLENLLLTHDSLISMILRYRIETRPVGTTGISTTLSRAEERQTILFWFVYGRDAFISLDRKMASQIRDEEVDLSGQLHGHETQSYFDAILGLAIIARKMARALCGPVARRKGVKHQDIEDIYKQLAEWRVDSYPPTLHNRPSGHFACPRESSLSLGKETKEFLPIQKAVIELLELNCFMQLEACVSQYGIEERSSMMGQIVDMRVKYKTLQAAYNIVEVSHWIEKVTINQQVSTSKITHAIVDLAPEVIRNICAGASNWILRKVSEIFRPTANEGLGNTVRITNSVSGIGSVAELSREQAMSWMDSSTRLRDIAATAASHRDTGRLIEQLDHRLGSLKALFKMNESE